MNRVNVPQLRFQEFDGIWNNTKLGEAFTIFNGYAFASSSSVDEGVLWVKIADVGIQEMKSNNLSHLPISLKEKHKKFILKKGDFVVALTRPILNGKLKIAQINSFFDGALLNQRVGKIISNNSHSFIYSLLQKTDLIKSIENNIAGSDPPNLSPNEINSIKIAIPSLPEQQKIASFLSAVDEKIQQLSRKKELLEQYKKGLMQQLFSGKLRFKDENGNYYADWEEKTFGAVARFVNGKAYKQVELLSEGKYRVLRVGNLFSNNEWYYSDLELDKDKYIEKGDLIYAWSASFGPRFWEQEKIIYHYHIWKVVPNENVDKLFLFHTFMFDVEKLKTQSQGGTMFHITKGNIETRLFNFPCLEEQQKIADFLSSIDTRIESTNQQITQTQSFKKGLLQQMFV
jgi:type I restriction enzyme S subunit